MNLVTNYQHSRLPARFFPHLGTQCEKCGLGSTPEGERSDSSTPRRHKHRRSPAGFLPDVRHLLSSLSPRACLSAVALRTVRLRRSRLPFAGPEAAAGPVFVLARGRTSDPHGQLLAEPFCRTSCRPSRLPRGAGEDVGAVIEGEAVGGDDAVDSRIGRIRGKR